MEEMIEYDPYEGLANGIIAQAAKDYKKYLIQFKNTKNPEKAHEILGSINAIERFFKSELYSILTKVNSEYIMERIKEQVGI